MSLSSLILSGVALSIFLAVVAVGMRIVPADLHYLLSKPARLAWSLLAMYVLAPIVALAVCHLASAHPAVTVAIVTLSISPVGVLFSQAMLPLVAPGHMAYARGLLFASAMLSVVLTPLAVEVIQLVYGGDVHVSPLAVAQVVIGTLLVPLGIGLAIGRWWPRARGWIPALQKAGSLVLLVCAVAIIASAWPLMASVYRVGTVTAIVLISLLWLAAGHLSGGPDEDDRTVLAFATASRHPGVAVAVGSLTDQPLAPVGVLLVVLVSELAVIPYKTWRKRRRAAAAESPAGPPAGAH
jgi:BASS family bile acid:Na+ symporter